MTQSIETITPTTEPARKPRGFAAISPERRSEIARMGGLSVKPENRSFARSRELAASAGRKGGAVRKAS